MMYLFDSRILGIMILLLLGFLVFVKRRATGSVLDNLQGDALVLLVNGFNLFFLLIVNPLTALLLIGRKVEIIPPARVPDGSGISLALELTGLALYVSGVFLMIQSLTALGSSYQLGGKVPRLEDRMVTSGPYKLIRHPIYSSALSISLGLAFLIHSWSYWVVFGIYCFLIMVLIRSEERGLRGVYGEKYEAYRKNVKKLIPLLY
jgi:protein-S-isoprenylcysteine O-methyltransferase Ste14